MHSLHHIVVPVAHARRKRAARPWRVHAASASAPPAALPPLRSSGSGSGLSRAQQAVLGAISGAKGRGKSGVDASQQAAFDSAVAELEASLASNRTETPAVGDAAASASAAVDAAADACKKSE